MATGLYADVVKYVDNAFTKYRGLSDMVSAAVYTAIADALVQLVHDKSHDPHNWRYNHLRTARLCLVGFLLGGVSHVWYKNLDHVIHGNDVTHAIIKVAMDQTFAGPFFLTCYIFATGLLEGRTFRAACLDWRSMFVDIYKVDIVFWPGAQFINFLFVPERFRVLYVNMATLVWNMFLTYFRHRHRRVEEAPMEVGPVPLATSASRH